LLSSTLFFFLLAGFPPTSTLFPYTTLFRSRRLQRPRGPRRRGGRAARDRREPARAERREDRRPAPQPGPLLDHGAGRSDLQPEPDRKSTRLNSSHVAISYAVFCLKKKKQPS